MEQADKQKNDGGNGLESTTDLLARIRGGDEAALRRMVEIYQPMLSRWASGRLPGHARGLVDTVDVVQSCMVNVLRRIDEFDPKHPGAFFAYLRRALLNQIRAEIRRASSRPRGPELEEVESALPSVEQEVGVDAVAEYEEALSQLNDTQQATVILRVEFAMKYREIASTLGLPSEDAARMQVSRALVRLAEKMQ